MARIPCKAIKANGEPCRAAAGPGGLCHLHANPDRAKTLGQMGGRKNRHFTGVDIEVRPNMNANDLCQLASRTIGLVLHGEVQAREAGAVAQLITAQSRLIPLIEFERRFATLERQVAHALERQVPISQQGREVSAEGARHGGTVADATELLTETEQQAEEDGTEALDAIENGDGRAAGVDSEEGNTSEAQTEIDSTSSEVH